MVRFAMSSEVSVTRRNRSVRWPTRPASTESAPFGRTVSTLTGSLNSGPVSTCPSLIVASELNCISSCLAIVALSSKLVERLMLVEQHTVTQHGPGACGIVSRPWSCPAIEIRPAAWPSGSCQRS